MKSYTGKEKRYRLGEMTILDERLHRARGGRGVDYLLNGMLSQDAGVGVPHNLVNFMFANSSGKMGDDLVAQTIQRGRDHGLPGYNDYRRFCGMPALCSWDKVPDEFEQETWKLLKVLFDSPADVDLFVAGMAETPLPGAAVGKTFACLIAKQFHNVKFGDRFFLSHRGPMVPYPFNDAQMSNIRKRSLADILCDNTRLFRVPKNPLIVKEDKDESAVKELVSCGQHFRLDIDLFSDKNEIGDNKGSTKVSHLQ